MSSTLINVEVRNETGKQAAKRLRRQGRVPGVYYGAGIDPVALSIDAKELRAALAHKSSIMDMRLGSTEPVKCIIREVQWHPVHGTPLHVDFMGVKLTEKITMEVPIRLTGTAAGVKDGGTLQQLLRTLEIKCLPLDIPDAIEVDVSHLNIHDAIFVRDLPTDKFEILNEPEQIVVSVLAPRLEETPAPAAAPEATEPEVIGHGKKAEEEEGEESQKK
ncbi:MAG: 50S ribosomal protein L25 [candidate division KSB1 bacterium]|nr:50S ribosomal protein L25 [candidate division KSB1 bacterium]MDZ7274774.1 50S ribosomal protein L25 [candidate division KSB1 bacterium]MDZ7285598.1 50S ribosomal protein L25 [candidate division KSB1 bacterium]MDZ7298630.1 50S ribosomal protein L25 [candidate division KSB1 bacterium]MDZ7307640.1 50S ribosomal protein L25 [candidate division KSB1 bacterium]